MARLKHFDPFTAAILLTVLLSALIPVTGTAATVYSWVLKTAIFILFFGYGCRLSQEQAFSALKHWKLHLTILSCTFVAFPLVGLGLQQLTHLGVPAIIAIGLGYLCISPSTVQSSITFTSIAGGNVPGAVISATLSNLIGVVLTPLLAIVVLPDVQGAPISVDSIIDVAAQLLLPFILGQLSRKWTATFMENHRKQSKFYDQFVIIMVVYGAFSAFFTGGQWAQVGWGNLALIAVVCVALLTGALSFTWWLGGVLKFNREDRIAIMMCGTKKSLATAAPIASILFPASAVGMIVLPIMVFHQLQLMACATIASRLGRSGSAQTA